MTTIRLNLKENAYPIIIGENILKNLPQYLKKLSLGKDAVIIPCRLLQCFLFTSHPVAL